jgi:hypothetical protein
VTRHGVWIRNWIYRTLRMVTVSNSSGLTDLYTLQIATPHAKSCQYIFNGRCLVTDPNNVLFYSGFYLLATISHLTHGSWCPHILDGLTNFRAQPSKLLYDWRLTAKEFVFASSPLYSRQETFFSTEPLGNSPYAISSLKIRWVYLLRICSTLRQAYVSHL